MLYSFSCFFFQAEDGIRDLTVTGVQTCALPISRRADPFPCVWRHALSAHPVDVLAAKANFVGDRSSRNHRCLAPTIELRKWYLVPFPAHPSQPQLTQLG